MGLALSVKFSRAKTKVNVLMRVQITSKRKFMIVMIFVKTNLQYFVTR